MIHLGDFDYDDDPEAWDSLISEVLGEDFPYFAAIGNHDEDVWPAVIKPASANRRREMRG